MKDTMYITVSQKRYRKQQQPNFAGYRGNKSVPEPEGYIYIFVIYSFTLLYQGVCCGIYNQNFPHYEKNK
jgi:hypothetical protein